MRGLTAIEHAVLENTKNVCPGTCGIESIVANVAGAWNDQAQQAVIYLMKRGLVGHPYQCPHRPENIHLLITSDGFLMLRINSTLNKAGTKL